MILKVPLPQKIHPVLFFQEMGLIHHTIPKIDSKLEHKPNGQAAVAASKDE